MLRADHVAGAAFIVFGLTVIALSGDLPFGDLAMPGAGFMPRLIAGLNILFGILLLLGAKESPHFAFIDWSDAKHAGIVVVILGVAIALFERLGFVMTMLLMMVGLLVIIERRNPLRAAVFSAAVVFVTFVSFEYLLRTPLAEGPFGF